MSDRYKLPQPYRNPGEFKAYLDGVKATVEALRPELSVDALAWGGGIPIDLTIYQKAEIAPELQFAKDVYEAEAETADTRSSHFLVRDQSINATPVRPA